MTRYAVLLGYSPIAECTQKTLLDFMDYLRSESGGSWAEREMLVCEGATPAFLRLLGQQLAGYDFVLVYSCTFGTVPRAVRLPECAAAQVLTLCACGTELVNESELGYERIG